MKKDAILPSYTRKPRASKLDPFAEEIQGWFEEEKITFTEAAQRLKTRGCSTSIDNLGRWWRRRRSNALEEQLLDQIEFAGDQCRKLDRAFRKSPAPVIDTLLKVHRVLVLKLNNQANADPKLIALASSAFKPLFEWTRIDMKREELEDAKLERRNEADLKRASEQRDATREGLRPETLEQIEKELKLL
jgi:hypothetical protein